MSNCYKPRFSIIDFVVIYIDITVASERGLVQLYYFSAEMDIFEENFFLEAIKKIRWGSKRPDTGSIFKLLTIDTATNITMKETKKKPSIDKRPRLSKIDKQNKVWTHFL